ncbi:MAG: cell surface protein SprA [Balneolales bacterium]
MQLVNHRNCFTVHAFLSFISFFLLFASEVQAQNETQNAGTAKAASGIGMGYTPRLADSLRRYRPDTYPVPLPFKRRRAGILELDHPRDVLVKKLDAEGNYVIQREIFGIPASLPVPYSFEEYAARSMRHTQSSNWRRLVREAERQRDVRRGLLDFTIDLPVGERSAFTTIFGRPEVNLRVTGTANMNVGVSIQETEDPLIPPDQQRRIDPTFDQNLQLNIQGTIGDKLSIRTDWDTERAFEFENRLNILYEGYEDEIIQSVELGNVAMETGNSLIRGGSALFGIKSRAQFGPLTLTSILSQQEGQGESQTISSGSQETEFSIAPAQYEDNRHFFLDFYNRQEFEEAMSDPNLSSRLYDITRLDVYVINMQQREVEGQRRAIALVDLGVNEGQGGFGLPDPDQDSFDGDELEQYRDPTQGVHASDLGISSDEFEEGYFVPLERGEDYTVDDALGYISLNQKLDSRQALAVSFAYRDDNNAIINVGDINQGDSDRMILKLLKPSNLTQSSSSWDLMMRNIYSLSATNLTSNNVEVDILFTGGNTDQSNLPDLNNILLRDMGLDRVGSQGEPGADNQVDFGTGTLDAERGRIVFPYLEPFGQRIVEIYNNSNLSTQAINDAIDQYAFPALYTNTQTNAREESQNNRYRIKGITRGGTQASHYLGIQLVEGSVRVRANNVELSEGIDYEVDYALGSILITNNRFLQSGQDITIDYEQNNLFQIQQTTFTGVRAEYAVNDNISLGSTWFRLKENPLQDKTRVGEEPINNSIIGFDARARFDASWLTRAIDWVPGLQTRAESNISFSGEFAHLRPDVSQTAAVRQAINRGELFPDEAQGLSFLDDYEGAKNSIRFMSPTRWHLAAAPHAVPGYDQISMEEEDVDGGLHSKIARSDLRAQFSWYMLPVSSALLRGVERTPESEVVRTTDVFPNRDAAREDEFLQTLDFHYNPGDRGPYNYNLDLKNLLENEPDRMWGGMTTALPSGSDNLTQGNYEFLEFWVQPVLPDGRQPTGQDLEDYEGTIYVDIGTVSEDVIPNNLLNTEDGLARRTLNVGPSGRSYMPRTIGDLTGQFSTETQAQEDIGLDGASSTGAGMSERALYSDFIAQMEAGYAGNPDMLERIRTDLSNDRYIYFDDPQVQNLPLHERFHRMYGYLEGNSTTGDESRAITNRPDTEGLINPATVNLDDSYYQYEIPWNPADSQTLSIGESFIVDKVDGQEQNDRWYLVRIPLREFTRKVGNIDNLEQVSHLRFWMSGYEQPFTMRFATFELVGNQWRKAVNVTGQNNPNTIFEVATINIEENSSREPIPYRIPEGAIRSVNRGQQEQVLANEQSMSLTVEDLRSGDVRMVRRLYQNGLNLLNYSNLRMFVHGEGYENRSDLEIVLRFGNDLTDNYYEYRQPVSPTDPNAPFSSLSAAQDLDAGVLLEEAERVWNYDENSVNLVLSSMNQLKQAREIDGFDHNEIYQRADLAEDAPPGTILSIIGEPSLSRVTEIGIGIRNPHADADNGSEIIGVPSLDAELWVNELRVSGFEDKKGWAANMSTQITMADFATVNASMRRSTDGFGGIDSRLESRQQEDNQDLDISSTVNLHRFLPERFGWNFPFSVSARHSQITPRFIPQLGDIRYDDFKNAVEASNLSEREQREEIRQTLHDIQSVTERYSVNLSNISKSNSRSWLARHTLDNTQLSYVYNVNNARNPNYIYQEGWNYRTGINYRLNIRNVHFITPFSAFETVPLLNILSGVEISYTPSSVNAAATLDRSYHEEQRRIPGGSGMDDINQNHNFTYRSNYGFNYTPTPTINTSFNSTTSFVLDDLGEVPSDGDDFRLRSSYEVFEDILIADSVSARRSDYQESYTAGWRPRLNHIPTLNWLNYAANFRGQFRWTNSAKGTHYGARLNNSFTLDHNPEIRVQTLLEKIPFYRAAKNAGDSGSRDIGYYGRRALLALLSLQNININYTQSGASAQSGYAGGSQLYDMFKNDRDASFSPTFLYRLGLDNRIPTDQIILPDEPIDFSAQKTFNDNINIRSGLRPFRDLDITLNWTTSWNETTNETQTIYPDSIASRLNQTGEISASVWAFGGGYTELFRSQLQKAFDGIGSTTVIDGRDADGTVLTSESLQEDFRHSYLGIGNGPVGDRSFTPVPLPNWQVTWSGWENRAGFLSDYLTRATLTHAYSGRYRLGWAMNPDAGSQLSRNVGAYTVRYERLDYDARTINLEKRFSPVLGLNLTWNNNMQTNLQYDYSKITSFSLSNNNINERISKGVRFTTGYSKRGFKLPFLERFNNQIDLNLTVSYSEDANLVYRLNQDLGDALSESPDQLNRDASQYTPERPEERGDARIQVTPSFKYQFSRTVTAGFEYSYRQLIPKSTGVYPRTDQDIRFNIVVSIRSN